MRRSQSQFASDLFATRKEQPNKKLLLRLSRLAGFRAPLACVRNEEKCAFRARRKLQLANQSMSAHLFATAIRAAKLISRAVEPKTAQANCASRLNLHFGNCEFANCRTFDKTPRSANLSSKRAKLRSKRRVSAEAVLNNANLSQFCKLCKIKAALDTQKAELKTQSFDNFAIDKFCFFRKAFIVCFYLICALFAQTRQTVF